MRVGRRALFVWSFLMASAHGAGLMLVPVLLTQPMLGIADTMVEPMPVGSMPAVTPAVSLPVILLAVLVHTLTLLMVAGILAIFFFESYEKVGLKLLRYTWLNFDLLWAFALLVAGFGALLS